MAEPEPTQKSRICEFEINSGPDTVAVIVDVTTAMDLIQTILYAIKRRLNAPDRKFYVSVSGSIISITESSVISIRTDREV